MQKITPFYWFDSNAEEAANFYTSIFPNSKINGLSHYNKAFEEVSGKPAGSVSVVDFNLNGQQFLALNGGSYYKLTPAVSMFVQVDTEEDAEAIWNKLAEGAFVMMEFQQYPFAKKFGWLADKFGVSWQIIACGIPMHISQCMMFTQGNVGKAEEAAKYYVDVFSKAPGTGWSNSKIEDLARYAEGEGDVVGYIKHGALTLAGETFKIMESSGPHKFGFSQATSFTVNVDTQEEVDYFYDTFAKDGEAQPCGWVLDKYGMAWQITPTILPKLTMGADEAKADKAAKAMFGMTKIIIKDLE